MEEQRNTFSDNDYDSGWPRTEGSYIGRHWNGDLSLPVSYWVNGVLLSIGFGILVYVVVYAVASNGSLGTAVTLIWVTLAISIVLSVWQLTGIWRSAARQYVSQHPRR